LSHTIGAVLILLFAISSSEPVQGQASAISELDTLLLAKQYTELEHSLATRESELTPVNRAFFQGVMANRTNQVEKSIRLIQPVLSILLATNTIHAQLALCTLADDYAKSFRYAEAAIAYTDADRVARGLRGEFECDARRQAARWRLLAGSPHQTVSGSRSFTVTGKRDAFGLFQIPVMAGNYTGSWVVDSGANLSVIRRSIAERIGLTVSRSEAVGQGVGAPVRVHTAVIPDLKVGKALLHNVAVVVVQDSALGDPKASYQIDGCLGFPALATFGAVTFYQDGRVRFGNVPRRQTNSFHNLFLENFTPLVAADLGIGIRLFALDTGAQGTVLSAQFYQEDTRAIDFTNPVSFELAGVGGSLSTTAYMLASVVARFGGECSIIEDVPLLTVATGLPDEFYGNIGQSALSSFSSFTLDFNAMHFSVSRGRRMFARCFLCGVEREFHCDAYPRDNH
jgi:predicted aspartyl protease